LHDKLDEFGINSCVQNKMALKYAKNYENWFQLFEDVSRRCEASNIAASLIWPTLYVQYGLY